MARPEVATLPQPNSHQNLGQVMLVYRVRLTMKLSFFVVVVEH